MRISIENMTEGIHPINIEDTLANDVFQDESCRLASPVKLNGTLMVSENSFVLQAGIDVAMTFSCGRCLERFSDKVNSEIATYYEKTDRAMPDGDDLNEVDDVEILDYSAKYLDVGHHVAELLNLNLPMKPLCSDDCKGLCSDCGTNLNESACSCEKQEIDPRWQTLITLKED